MLATLKLGQLPGARRNAQGHTWHGRGCRRAGQQACLALIQGVQANGLTALASGAHAPQVRLGEALQHWPHHQLLACTCIRLPLVSFQSSQTMSLFTP